MHQLEAFQELQMARRQATAQLRLHSPNRVFAGRRRRGRVDPIARDGRLAAIEQPLRAGSDIVEEAQQAVLVIAEEMHRSEEHTSELQSLMRNSYAVFCLKK